MIVHLVGYQPQLLPLYTTVGASARVGVRCRAKRTRCHSQEFRRRTHHLTTLPLSSRPAIRYCALTGSCADAILSPGLVHSPDAGRWAAASQRITSSRRVEHLDCRYRLIKLLSGVGSLFFPGRGHAPQIILSPGRLGLCCWRFFSDVVRPDCHPCGEGQPRGGDAMANAGRR
jgi:hypothetical protein